MSHFEYLSVSVAIVLSLAAARAIGGLPTALNREAGYWLHAAWILVWLWVLVASWWNIWSYRAVDFSFAVFLVLLAPSGPLLFLASVLVPENPESHASWRSYFESIRSRHFLAAAAFWALLLAHQPILYDRTIINDSSLFLVVLLAAALLGAAFANTRVQALVLCVTAFVAALFFPAW